MVATDLHTEGWRQGSILAADLPATYLAAGAGKFVVTERVFSRWVVCTQDCDLRSSPVDSPEPIVELRPVLSQDPPEHMGIRSRRFLLASGLFVDASEPRCMVSPALLTTLVWARQPPLSDARCRAFKTWLGLRYDRPAVPDHLVELARDVAKRCGSRSGRAAGELVHDVLMQFDESAHPPQVALFAVIADDADPEVVRSWLSTAASRVRPELGVVAYIDVGTRRETPLDLVETSYAADLSQLTWGGGDPVGAE
jgi:hypothetical protein